MTSLVEFLTARLKEDQDVAMAAKVRANGNIMYLDGRDAPVGGAGAGGGGVRSLGGDFNRALREVESKRRIVEWASVYGYTKLLEELAYPYSDHADYGQWDT